MANIRIADGESTVSCSGCDKSSKSVYVFSGMSNAENPIQFDYPLCLNCLGKAASMLAAIEGVQNPVRQGYQAKYPGEAPLPRVGMTKELEQFNAMMDDSNFEYEEAPEAKAAPVASNGKPIKMPSWARNIAAELKEVTEEFGGEIPGSEIKKVLETAGINERMDPYPFLNIARQYGIASSHAKSMWDSVVANQRINRATEK